MEEVKIESQESTKTIKNKYSIYDYLIKNPSVLLAVVSAGIAVVTFFAKLATLISSRKALSFWEFDSAYATFGNDSIVYTVIFAIIFSLLTSFSSMLFSYTVEAYVPRKRCHLMAKYILKNKTLKKTIKKSKRKKLIKQETRLLETVKKLKESTKESKKHAFKDLFFNLFFVFIINLFNSLLFAVIVDTNSNIDTWIIAVIFLFVQILIILLLKILTEKRILKKKEIKKNCNDAEFIIKIYEEINSKEYPFNYVFKNGFRSVLSNSNIISTCAMILISCFVLCCMFSFTKTDYIDESKEFQITTIDGTQYAIVYQNDEQFFLEEIEIKVNDAESAVENKTLIIYTNRQRIITTEDISISVEEFQKITTKHK
ncbi:MAG: hypothetical protein IKL10_07530 [Clostridia bacterium]|nr:hypothetical protein [Clostridia bacterium]